jgi:hypothetical protein
VGKLEDRFAISSGEPKPGFRLILRRTLTTPGAVIELVNLHGTDCNFSDDELDEFVAGFPIETVAGGSGLSARSPR